MSAIAAATVANEPVSAEPEPSAYGSRENAYYILFLVFTGLLLAFVDRMIISVLIEPCNGLYFGVVWTDLFTWMEAN